MSSTDLASARTLVLAFLTNSDDDQTVEYAENNLKALELSGRIDLFQYIVDCGYEFARIYDYDERDMLPIREKFEETEELSWSKFESLMDSACGVDFNIKSISYFLAIVNQIRVPAQEIDDLLDLAAWYASTRVISLVNENGGWRNFKDIITQEMESKLTKLDQSITMSQFERTIQEVEMGSMVVLQDSSPEGILQDSTTSTITGTSTMEESDRMTQTENETEIQSEPEQVSEEIHSNEEFISNDRNASISSSVFENQDKNSDGKSTSSVNSFDRLSNSPVLVSTGQSTPGMLTPPVYLSSQPDSVDFSEVDSNSSFNDSLINELINNCQANPPQMSSSSDIEETGFNINRNDTVKTLEPSASIPIRSKTQDSFQEDLSPKFDGSYASDSMDGIRLRVMPSQNEPLVQSESTESVDDRLREELELEDEADHEESEEKENKPPVQIPFIEKLHTSQAFSHDVSAENMAKQTNYFLLAGAAVVGLAAVYLKTSR